MPRLHTAGRTRPDRCPGVLSVHPAADGGLARIRLPGGRLTSTQLQVLLSAAIELGDGGLELTSRANIQLRALRPGAEHELSDRLYDAGLLPSLSHERVRNIVASPRTGLDSVSSYDVGSLVAEVDRRLRDSPALADLPGRFLFGLDDGRGDIVDLSPDVAAQAISTGQADGLAAGFLLAGRDTGIRVPWPDIPELLIAAAEAFLAERRAQHSVAWRIAELDDGPTAILTRLNLAGHDRSRERHPTPTAAGRPQPPTGLADPGTPPHGHDGQNPAATGVAKLGVSASLATPVGGPSSSTEPGLGSRAGIGVWHRPDGAAAAEVGVRLGRLSQEQAALLAAAGAAATERHGSARAESRESVQTETVGSDLGSAGVELRVTPWRSVVVPELAGDLDEWLARFVAAGFVVDPGSAWVGVTACAGRPGCASALADVRADAERVVPRLTAGGPVHWAGCERRCGRPSGAVDVVATGNGYAVDGTSVDGMGDGAAGLAGAIDGARRVTR